MIQIKDIHKDFDNTPILKGITSEFKRGQTNLVIGQSGSGKTVLLKILLGLFTPDQGEIYFDGIPFSSMTEDEHRILRREIGMVFQGSASFIEGIQMEFNSFHVVYAFVKTFLFAIILATIPSYHGYYMKGGALDVGRASTVSFVWCSVVIIVVNYFITQLFFS